MEKGVRRGGECCRHRWNLGMLVRRLDRVGMMGGCWMVVKVEEGEEGEASEKDERGRRGRRVGGERGSLVGGLALEGGWRVGM